MNCICWSFIFWPYFSHEVFGFSCASPRKHLILIDRAWNKPGNPSIYLGVMHLTKTSERAMPFSLLLFEPLRFLKCCTAWIYYVSPPRLQSVTEGGLTWRILRVVGGKSLCSHFSRVSPPVFKHQHFLLLCTKPYLPQLLYTTFPTNITAVL